MTSDTIELVERVRRRLKEHENPCEIAGPVPEAAISAAEAALGCRFPPSYRNFLRTFGGGNEGIAELFDFARGQRTGAGLWIV